MTRFHVYVILTIVGTVLPLWQFLPWIAEHGFDVPLFFSDLFANRISAFFAMDVLVSAVVVLVMLRHAPVPFGGLVVPATLLVGVSCGLPLYLSLRERAR